jgi:hypothetical protein
VKRILLALLPVIVAVCWAEVPSAHAQNTFMNGSMPAAGLSVFELLEKGKTASMGTTDSMGVPSNMSEIMNSGVAEFYEYLCSDNKTVKLVKVGLNPDDAPPPCPGRWRRLGAYFPGRGPATTQIGSGAGVFQSGTTGPGFGGGPYTPGRGEFWFGGYVGPDFINRGLTAFNGEGELGFRYAPRKCFAFGPLVGGGGTNSILVEHFGGPSGGSMPTSFENFYAGLANFKIGLDVNIALPRNFYLGFNVLGVDTFERDKVTGGTCLGNNCTTSFTDTFHDSLWNVAGGATLKHPIWHTPSWNTQLDAALGYEYYAGDARQNSLRFGVEFRTNVGRK